MPIEAGETRCAGLHLACVQFFRGNISAPLAMTRRTWFKVDPRLASGSLQPRRLLSSALLGGKDPNASRFRGRQPAKRSECSLPSSPLKAQAHIRAEGTSPMSRNPRHCSHRPCRDTEVPTPAPEACWSHASSSLGPRPDFSFQRYPSPADSFSTSSSQIVGYLTALHLPCQAVISCNVGKK